MDCRLPRPDRAAMLRQLRSAGGNAAEFVPADLRRSLLGLLTLSLLVAWRRADRSWQSALALNVEEKGRATLAIPVWTFSLGWRLWLGGPTPHGGR